MNSQDDPHDPVPFIRREEMRGLDALLAEARPALRQARLGVWLALVSMVLVLVTAGFTGWQAWRLALR